MTDRLSLPTRIRDLLDPVGRKFGLDGAVETGRVFARWKETVGAEIAEHAEPTSLKNGVLRVRAESPAWATELGYLAGEISARVNADVGHRLVSEVQVWTGPAPKRQARTRSTKEARHARPAPREEAEQDPLAALTRARRAWLERRRKRAPDQPL